MAIIEEVMDMKRQGLPDANIIQALKDRGVSPREINEAISQSNIKSAINTNPQDPNEGDEEPKDEKTNLQPSMMPPGEIRKQRNAPELQPTGEDEEGYTEYDYANPPAPQSSQNYQSYQAPQYPEYQTQQSVDVGIINDIAEQIVEEKNQRLKEQVSALIKVQGKIDSDLEIIKERVERLEKDFDKLQMAILEKVGSYGDNIQNISDEMRKSQESFSKMLNPILDKANQSQGSETPPNNPPKTEKSPPRKTPGKKKDSFESYLR